jgi:DNA-binding response OmpR family regulator
MTKVLVVEDEPDVRLAVRVLLQNAGFDVLEAVNGREALRLLFDGRPDLVLLDVTMPELDGWQTLDRLRDMGDVPILMLTARDAESDRVRGLNAGADDYLVKPFGGQELIARVNALLRRAPAAQESKGSVQSGSLLLDLLRRRAFFAGSELELTALEFRVLCELVSHADQVLSEEQLLRRAWNDPSGIGPERVKFLIHRLRKKLAAADAPTGLIESVRGSGYRYRP